ncbi:MAG: hypothetical protein NTW28_23790, partial [Candidatus Solibacter sp.]|nr:hypothetical protein [Candidatus Solibacter sp.]
MRQIPALAVIALGLSAAPCALGQQFMRGKVIMPDASAPPQKAFIERVCPASIPMREAVTNRQGEFLWRSDSYGDVKRLGSLSDLGRMRCGLRARIPGFESDRIDIHDPVVLRNLQLPTMVLHPVSADTEPGGPALPRAVVKPWNLGIKASDARQWAEAERRLREVTRVAPAFGPAWGALGYAYHNQNKAAEARDALQRAVAADPASLPARLQLLRLEMSSQLWADAAKTAGALIQADAGHRYPEANLQLAIARYQLHDLEAARTGLLETIRLDARHELPQAQYLVGALLMEQGDAAGAAAHLRSYLERVPSAADAATVRAAIESLSRPGSPHPPALPVAESLPANAVEPVVTTTGEAWVPGGRKALAALAHMKGTPSAENFFLEYCRAVSLETSPLTPSPVAGYTAALETYLVNIAELMDLGERREAGTLITLSLAAGEARQRTTRILQLLGWKVTSGNGTASIELGNQPADWPRQQILPALGVDALAMQQALGAGRSFQFEIVSENADLAGGTAWAALTKEFSALPGGIAEGFVRQVHLARAYAGLGNMGGETAMALARRMGLTTLATVYADSLWMNGEAFRVSAGRAAVPGGAAAEEVWAKLAGANPLDPERFFEAILKGDRGRLAGFYAALARGDAAHQKFFTRDLARAQRYYAWYREAEETRVAVRNPALAWRALVFQNLPLNERGEVGYPGGRAAWSPAASDDDALVPAQSIGGARIVQPAPPVDMEALMAVARLEHERARSLDADSAKLLAGNFTAWRWLFPYFQALPGLGAEEFQALADFTGAVSGNARPEQDLALGEWHSLVALIVLGGRAGSLNDGAAARAFGRVCRMTSDRDHGAEALAILREISGGGPNLEEGVTNGLLRLSGARRAAFARLRDLQSAPHLDRLSGSSDAATLVAALSG